MGAASLEKQTGLGPEDFDQKEPQAEEASTHSVGDARDQRVVCAAEKKLVRKLDNRILPIACLMYLFACT
jgi:hypothetical protein